MESGDRLECRLWHGRPIVAAVICIAGLALLTGACGASPGGGVAQLGSTTAHTSAASVAGSPGGAASSSEPAATQVLAFSRCMRFHGVTGFPDPDGRGVLPKRELARQAASEPQFAPAHRACEHLLPNGGQPSQSQVEQAWSDMRNFARCLRSHGVPDWPDPTVTSRQDDRPFFYLPSSIDPSAPHVIATMNACEHLMHAANPLVTTQ